MTRSLARVVILCLPVFVAFACKPEDAPLGTTGSLCDEDIQCVRPLTCACVEIRGTGDDGNDEIINHGTCQVRGYKCIKDAGVDSTPPDTAPTDTGADDAADVGDASGDVEIDSAIDGAADTGAADGADDGG